MSLYSNFQDIITVVKQSLSKIDNKKADKTTVNNKFNQIDAETTSLNRYIASVENEVNKINEYIVISFSISTNESSPTGYIINFNQSLKTIYDALKSNVNMYMWCRTSRTFETRNFADKLFKLESAYFDYYDFYATFSIIENDYKAIIELPKTSLDDLEDIYSTNYFYIENDFSGNYNDLTNKPTSLSDFNNDLGYFIQADADGYYINV